MKKTIILLVCVSLATVLFAQTPLKMSYQAVIRNSSNQLVTNSQIGMRINILKGTSGGATVYTEIVQTTSTNANGLVTVEIGSGNITFGGLGIIDWAHGPYFLKTETDPGGGTNYTITGTSELLSVPYALFATQTDNGFSGNYYDLSNKPALFDGSWNSLTGKPAFAAVATSGNYNDLNNNPALFSGNYNDLNNKPILDKVATSGSYNDLSDKPITDGSETKVTAGTNISVSGKGTSASPYIINLDIPHYIGELYGGGVVFDTDPTGKHGLICSMTDLDSEVWSNLSDSIGPAAFSTWDGQSNTLKIIAQAGHISSAAILCDTYTNTDYGTGIYSDWFLPSIKQLCQLNKALYEVNKSLESYSISNTTPIFEQKYWTSNECRIPGYAEYDVAWFYNFEARNFFPNRKSTSLAARPVRAF